MNSCFHYTIFSKSFIFKFIEPELPVDFLGMVEKSGTDVVYLTTN